MRSGQHCNHKVNDSLDPVQKSNRISLSFQEMLPQFSDDVAMWDFRFSAMPFGQKYENLTQVFVLMNTSGLKDWTSDEILPPFFVVTWM